LFYSGGGGGGSQQGGTTGTGGSSVGGNGGTAGGVDSPGVDASPANRGGGGGGASYGNASGAKGGDGSSGVVIIRYLDTYPAAASTTGSPTIATTGGYRIYTWTSSGSITF
jgi:hypothetical protein